MCHIEGYSKSVGIHGHTKQDLVYVKNFKILTVLIFQILLGLIVDQCSKINVQRTPTLAPISFWTDQHFSIKFYPISDYPFLYFLLEFTISSWKWIVHCVKIDESNKKCEESYI